MPDGTCMRVDPLPPASRGAPTDARRRVGFATSQWGVTSVELDVGVTRMSP